MAYRRNDGSAKPGSRNRASTAVREYTKSSGRRALELSDVALEYLQALAAEAVVAGCGVYIGAPSTTGGRKVRLYSDDDAAELYLTPQDDPAEEVGGFCDFALGGQFEKAVHERVSARRTGSQSAARKRAEPTSHTAPGAIDAPGASEGP